MYFEKIGNLTIEDLELKPAHDLGLALSFGMFRASENITLQAIWDGRVFLDCVKNGKTDTYEGICAKEELEQLKKIYDEGFED